MPSTLDILLFGEFGLAYNGKPIARINAERLQSLLAYLVLHRHLPQFRQKLAVKLWMDVAEPQARANLRRRLHDLRRLLPNAEQFLLINPTTIQWNPHSPFTLDVAEFEEAIAQAKLAKQAGNLDNLRQQWENAIALYTGQLLPHCDDEWIVPTRNTFKQQAIQALSELVALLMAQGDYSAGIAYAQQWLQLDSLSESAYFSLMQLYTKVSDRARALQVYHQCLTVLREELGIDPSPTTCQLYQQLLTLDDAEVCEEPPRYENNLNSILFRQEDTPSTSSECLLPLIGREQEWTKIRQWLNLESNHPVSKLLLLSGEPGIGKTRLLEEIAQAVRQVQGCVLWARGFEAEIWRPYGVWIDALRQIAIESQLSPELETLLFSTVTRQDSIADRSRLFDAVVNFIAQLTVNQSPILLVLDDIQWLDEASVALLHYVARLLQHYPVLIACANRCRELSDNRSVYNLIQTFQQENRIQQLLLAPLNCKDIAQLAQTSENGIPVNSDRIFADSGGNPLFALELVRSLSHPQNAAFNNLETLIQGRLHQLSDSARELIPWLAALGRSFNPTILAQVSPLSVTQLLTTIEQLEHHGIIRPSTAISEEMKYDFAHDIVRQVAYQQISPPCRQLIHLQIAQAFYAMADANPNLMGEVVYHASLGGDEQLTASAAVMAAEQSLRLFAYTEAAELAQCGIQHCQHVLDPPLRIRLHLQLLRTYVKAGISRDEVSQVTSEIHRLMNEAIALGLTDEEAIGLEALINLNYDCGNLSGVYQHSLQAAEQGRKASPHTTAYMLAHTGSCLAEIGRDFHRCEALLLEATSLADRLGLKIIDIPFGMGMIRHYQSKMTEARQLLAQGWRMSQLAQDHWRECACLMNLVMVEIESRQWHQALDYCSEFVTVSAQMTGGSEAIHVAALDALIRYGLGENNAEQAMARSRLALQRLDSPRMLCYIQTIAAELDLQNQNPEQAINRAQDALQAAEIVNHSSELVLAWTVLIQAEISLEDNNIATQHWQQLKQQIGKQGLSHRANTALQELEQQFLPITETS